MIWRRLLSKKSLRCISTEALSSNHGVLSSPKFHCSARLPHINGKDEAGNSFTRVLLNPLTVQSTLANCPSDLISLSFFLWCARQRNYFHDRYAFAHMVNVVERLIERYKSVDGVVQELERIGCLVKPQTFLLLLRIFWHGGLFQPMFCVWDTMVRFGFEPNTFAHNVVMDVCFKTGHPEIALRILSEIRAPNFLSFNIALCHFCKVNDLVNIKVVLRNMLRAGYYPNEETFVMVLSCFSKKGRLVEAFQVFGFMVSLGFPASLLVWNILIDGFCKIGRPAWAGYLLEKMIDSGCSPNVITFTSLCKGFLKLEMVNDASQVLDKMESQGCEIDLFHCNVLIDCLSKMGRHEEALETFFNLKKLKLEPDSYTFSSVVSSLCCSGKYEILSKVLDGFSAPADLVLCNSLLSYFCKAGSPKRAVELYDNILDLHLTPDKYSYTGLLDGLCRSGEINQAVNVHRGMMMGGFPLDAHIHTLIISKLFRFRKYHTAHRLFREIVSKEHVLDAVSFRIVIHGLVRGGMVQEAFTVYCQMRSLGMVPEASTHNVMLYGFCQIGDLDMVTELLKQMLDEKAELNIRNFLRVCDIINSSRQYHEIIHILTKMWDSKLVPGRAMRVIGLCSEIKVDEKDYVLLPAVPLEDSSTETSGSEDLLEVATVG